MDTFPLLLAVVFLAAGGWSVAQARVPVAGDAEPAGFLNQRRGRLTLGVLCIAVGLLWLVAAAT